MLVAISLALALAASTALAQPTETLTPIPSPAPEATPAVVPTTLNITPQNPTIDVGGQVQLNVTMTYSNGKVSPYINNELEWTTDNETIAEVQGSPDTQIYQRSGPSTSKGEFKNGGPTGEVNGMGPGTATITVKFAMLSANTKVTVKGSPLPSPPSMVLPTPGAMSTAVPMQM